MSVTAQIRKVTLAVGAVTLVTGAAIAGTAVSASAAIAQTFKICAYGNYAVQGEIPQQEGRATFKAYPGHCRSIELLKGDTYAKVWGFYNTHNNVRFSVGIAHFSASKGWSGAAEGKTTSHSLHKFS
jgi:hypothetical protein